MFRPRDDLEHPRLQPEIDVIKLLVAWSQVFLLSPCALIKGAMVEDLAYGRRGHVNSFFTSSPTPEGGMSYSFHCSHQEKQVGLSYWD